eukprot:CAMPEP_0182594988 /NCGR_PEP_ID=MMETSP1324-20130603/81312_1 /TAXON_ID=236786 /ORGANISM="Florenciella sp., Strain RCC1587" /LENGTH=162 /DNA_ID=CAMNT_0024812567 /DNA_START=58 /DNA_END=547 /DNA_ORIENTATION=-
MKPSLIFALMFPVLSSTNVAGALTDTGAKLSVDPPLDAPGYVPHGHILLERLVVLALEGRHRERLVGRFDDEREVTLDELGARRWVVEHVAHGRALVALRAVEAYGDVIGAHDLAEEIPVRQPNELERQLDRLDLQQGLARADTATGSRALIVPTVGAATRE